MVCGIILLENLNITGNMIFKNCQECQITMFGSIKKIFKNVIIIVKLPMVVHGDWFVHFLKILLNYQKCSHWKFSSQHWKVDWSKVVGSGLVIDGQCSIDSRCWWVVFNGGSWWLMVVNDSSWWWVEVLMVVRNRTLQ